MKSYATSGSKSGGGGGGGKEDRRSLYERDRYCDPDMDRGRPGYRSSRERRHDHDDEERERRRLDWEETERRRRDRDRERNEAERQRRRCDQDEAERQRRRRDRDEAERERSRRDLDWEEMKRERRRRDREDKEKESENDRERWKNREKDKEREKNRITEDEMCKENNKGNENVTNKDEGQGRKRKSGWDEVGDNAGCSTFGVMATHPTSPLTTIALRPQVPAPGPLPPSSLAVDSSHKVSECLRLENLFDGSIRREDNFYLDVRDHVHRNCARCGPVDHIHVDRKGFVYLRFDSTRTALKAKEKWHGSLYEGRVITAKYMDIAKYRSRFPL